MSGKVGCSAYDVTKAEETVQVLAPTEEREGWSWRISYDGGYELLDRGFANVEVVGTTTRQPRNTALKVVRHYTWSLRCEVDARTYYGIRRKSTGGTICGGHRVQERSTSNVDEAQYLRAQIGLSMQDEGKEW